MVFPAGKTFLISALDVTRSHTELHIEAGAKLLVSDDMGKFPSGRHIITAEVR